MQADIPGGRQDSISLAIGRNSIHYASIPDYHGLIFTGLGPEFMLHKAAKSFII